jgi:shikimate dehydrogenase
VSPAAATSLYVLVGKPVAGNPTQEMLEAAFAAAGLDARYVSLDVEDAALADAVRGLRALGVQGAHVTVPHKVAVVPMLDQLTDAARLTGAVNCIKREGDALVGDNTDGKGFLVSLRRVTDPKGKSAVVIGAGGAARAIVAELSLAGAARITVVNRTLAKAEEVAAAVGAPCEAAQLTEPWTVPADAEIVVQATTVGMGDTDARLPLAWSEAAGLAADVVIAPPRTAFLRDAETAGRQTLEGLEMLVEQALVGFRWWTGAEPDADAMRDALVRELGAEALVA